MPEVAHYVLQRGHNGSPIAQDAADVDQLLQTLREAALTCGVVLHAYAVSATDLHVLATPDSDTGISRAMQALGRRYAAGFNRRHGRTGGLWDGRFRSALVEAGEPLLLALRRIDALGQGPADEPHRIGGWRDPAVVDPPEYWRLGNTPFERESRYRDLLHEPIAAPAGSALDAAVRGSWAVGSSTFLQGLTQATARPAAPRPRGRPRRTA